MVWIISIVAVLSGFTLTFAYARLMFTGALVVKYLAASIVYISSAFMLRTFYWDIIPDSFKHWLAEIAPIITRDFMNSGFILIFIVGAMYGSAAIHEMLPDEDKNKWSRFNAWMYPPLWKWRKK